MTIQKSASPSGEPSRDTAPDAGVQEITDWAGGYVSRHPLASLTTVGDQFVLGVRTIQYLIIDLLTGRFQWQEFIRQGAFMAGTRLTKSSSRSGAQFISNSTRLRPSKTLVISNKISSIYCFLSGSFFTWY